MSVLNIHSIESHLEGEYQAVKDQRAKNKKEGKKDKTTQYLQVV